MTYDAPLTRYRRFCTGTIFYPDPSAQWGHRIPKVNSNLDPPYIGCYSTLIVTMGLSSTVNPQCTPRQTDRRTDMLLAIAHALHAWHRSAKTIRLLATTVCMNYSFLHLVQFLHYLIFAGTRARQVCKTDSDDSINSMCQKYVSRRHVNRITNNCQRSKKRCPVRKCGRLVCSLPRHLNIVHSWTKEASRTAVNRLGLRKSCVSKQNKTDYHHYRQCPVKGCLSIVKRLPPHLRKHHHICDEIKIRKLLLLSKTAGQRRSGEQSAPSRDIELVPLNENENDSSDDCIPVSSYRNNDGELSKNCSFYNPSTPPGTTSESS